MFAPEPVSMIGRCGFGDGKETGRLHFVMPHRSHGIGEIIVTLENRPGRVDWETSTIAVGVGHRGHHELSQCCDRGAFLTDVNAVRQKKRETVE